MKPILSTALFFLSFSVQGQSFITSYPVTPKDTITDNYFGTVVKDPYRWLESDSTLRTREWIAGENAFSGAYLKPLLKKYDLENQLKFNSHFDFGSLHKDRGFYEEYRRLYGQKIYSLYLRSSVDASPDLAIDPADYKRISSDIVQIKGTRISADNKYIAFGLSFNGSDWNEIHVERMYPFRKLPDVLRWVKFSSIEWRGDGFFYCTYDSVDASVLLTAANRHPKLFYHRLGTSQSEDRVIFQDSLLETAKIEFSVFGHERYLVINHKGAYRGQQYNKISFIDFKGDSQQVTDLLLSRTYYDVIGLYKGKLLLSAGSDAGMGALYLASIEEPGQMEEFVPEHKEVLKKATIVGDKVICIYLNDIDYIAITFDKDGKAVNKIAYPVGTSVDGFEGEEDDPKTVFFYHSFLYPPIAYRYDVNTLQVSLIQHTEVNYDQWDFEMRKVYYTSKDGQRIPMIIAGKKGFTLTGDHPTVLYGYGGYGISMTPFFDIGFINHLQSGGLVALPCLRGGGEYGEKWHAMGKMFHKQNVFDDFIAAAEYLKNEHYTCKEKLAIMGGSNGGLLVAAVLNQRPDLCQVAVADKGVFDMLRYQHYTIGSLWKNEFGTSEDSAQFHYLYQYSPLHNVKDTAYPAILILTGDHDDRVVPMHAYKFVAALQEKNKGRAPVLLLTEKNTGHSNESVQTEAEIYSFIYEQMGMKPILRLN